MSGHLIIKCGGCGEKLLESVLSLGASAPSCSMRTVYDPRGPEMTYPLELMCCPCCKLVQLSCVVDPKSIFHSDYPYSSANSGELRENFAQLAKSVHQVISLQKGDLVLDIGANDGTLLSNFPERTTRLGVDPTDQVLKAASKPGIQTWQGFFDREVAGEIRTEYGQAKVITACNVLAHVTDINDVLEGIDHLLADDGLLVCENHDLASIVEGGQWDSVYHEHLRFFSPYTLTRLLSDHNLWVDRVEQIPTHGGSFRTFVRRPAHVTKGLFLVGRDYDFRALQARAQRTRAHLRSMLASLRAGGERIGAVGATARANTIIGYCGLDVEDIEAVYEVSGSDKIDRVMAGTSIPVLDEEALFKSHAPDYVVLFSWHLADRIIPKLHPPGSRDAGYKGHILVPLPQMKIHYRKGD